jgi:hypothetical protein
MTALDGMRMKITVIDQSSNKSQIKGEFLFTLHFGRMLIWFYGWDINDGKKAQAADRE